MQIPNKVQESEWVSLVEVAIEAVSAWLDRADLTATRWIELLSIEDGSTDDVKTDFAQQLFDYPPRPDEIGATVLAAYIEEARLDWTDHEDSAGIEGRAVELAWYEAIDMAEDILTQREAT